MHLEQILNTEKRSIATWKSDMLSYSVYMLEVNDDLHGVAMDYTQHTYNVRDTTYN